MRLARALALAGVASRRKAETLIAEGEVEVNGKLVTNVATNVEPERDEIRVCGSRLRTEQKTYLLLNKPRGVVSTAKDPFGRRTVIDFVPSKFKGRLYPVGRLDRESTGLILLTNDGDLAHRLTHPSFHVPKRYFVKLDKPLEEKHARSFERGIVIEGSRTAPCRLVKRRSAAQSHGTMRLASCRIRFRSGSSQVEVELYEGRKRQIRIMFAARGYFVQKLERFGFGDLRISGLPPGKIRALTPAEVQALKKSVGL